MTSQELLSILGNVKNEYVLQAQKLRSGEARPQVLRLQKRRVMLIAAIVALMLLLVGCAVYVWSMKDLIFSTTSVWEQPAYRLSLQGFTGSPGYQATKEWFEFLDTYDDDGSLLENALYDDYVEPEAYKPYACYTEEMVNKVDELCRKYGLELMGRYYQGTPEELYQAVGISSIFVPEPAKQYQLWQENCYYADGSFTLWGQVSATQSEFRYWCMRKQSFCNFYITITDIDSYQQWNYTTRNGANLLLAVGPERSLILADQPDTFLSVYLYAALGQEELEAVAEDFDFTFHSQPADTAFAEEQAAQQLAEEEAERESVQALYARPTYEEFIPNYVNTVDDRYYTLLDLNGDGVQELAYAEGSTYQALMTISQGKVIVLDSISYPNGFALYRSEDGEYLVQTTKNVGNQTLFAFLELQGDQLVYREFLRYDPDTDWDNPFYRCTNARGKTVLQLAEEGMRWESVSEETYQGIWSNFLYPSELKKLPITDFFPDGNFESSKPFVQKDFDTILKDLQANPDQTLSHYYTFLDVTGDGSPELLLGTEDSIGTILTIRNNQTYELVNFYETGGIYWCGNTVILRIVTEETNVRHYFYSLTENGLDVFVVLLSDGTNWYTSPDGGVNSTEWFEISEADYNLYLASYPPIQLDMKPIAEYESASG